jgi:hypothetical protein
VQAFPIIGGMALIIESTTQIPSRLTEVIHDVSRSDRTEAVGMSIALPACGIIVTGQTTGGDLVVRILCLTNMERIYWFFLSPTGVNTHEMKGL